MDWQLVASYFTVKSTDIFCSVCYFSLYFNIKSYWYLKVNFLGSENLVEISVVWDELKTLRYREFAVSGDFNLS